MFCPDANLEHKTCASLDFNTKSHADALHFQFQCDVMQGFAPFTKTAFASKHSMSNAI
jgi:hypothetical protein